MDEAARCLCFVPLIVALRISFVLSLAVSRSTHGCVSFYRWRFRSTDGCVFLSMTVFRSADECVSFYYWLCFVLPMAAFRSVVGCVLFCRWLYFDLLMVVFHSTDGRFVLLMGVVRSNDVDIWFTG